MKFRLFWLQTGKAAGRLFSPAFWRRRHLLRARAKAADMRLPQSGLLTASVLRELLKDDEPAGPR